MAIVAPFGGSAAGLLLLSVPDAYRALAPALAYAFAETASAASPSGAGGGRTAADKSCSTAACMSRLVRDWNVARNCCPKKRADARGSGGGGGGADSGDWDANGGCCWLIIAPLIVELVD